MRELWNRFRYWLIKLLGGYPTQYPPLPKQEPEAFLPRPLLTPTLNRIVPQQLAVCISVPGDVYRFSPDNDVESFVRHRLANALADELTNSEYLELQQHHEMERDTRIYRASVFLIRPDEARR